jgi:hypothetical protein
MLSYIQRGDKTMLDKTWNEVEQKMLRRAAKDESQWRVRFRRAYNTNKLQVCLTRIDESETDYLMSWDGEKLIGGDSKQVKTNWPDIPDWIIRNHKLPPPKDVPPTTGEIRKYSASPNLEKWQPGVEIGVFDGATWCLAEKIDDRPRAIWHNYILYASAPVPHKATYYLSWNGERLAKNDHSTILEEYRPDLYKVVMGKLQEIN